jgi:hypothetical protein
VVYGRRRGLDRPGARDPMGPMRLMGPMRPPHKSHESHKSHPFTASSASRSATRVHTPTGSPSS